MSRGHWTALRAGGRRWLSRPAVRVAASAVAAVGLVAALGSRRDEAAGALFAHPYFCVERIDIRGAGNLVSEEEVRRWAGVDVGQSLWEADPASVRARLKAHPMVRSASVRRIFPDRIDIRVREHRPAAITVADDIYYIDRTGERFGPLSRVHDRDYPVFTGVPDKTDGRRRWALRRALHMLRRGDGTGLEISEVHLDPVDGLILLPSSPRVPLILGWHGWERRLQKGLRALRSLDAAAERLAVVDLRFRDQVVVRLREIAPAPVGSSRLPKVST